MLSYLSFPTSYVTLEHTLIQILRYNAIMHEIVVFLRPN